ncbi:MAG: hypothetical protein HYS05_15845, partial [Acidobacteria bacterium]|nr:hypothetical protein [Acidobacteriota bacterium]
PIGPASMSGRISDLAIYEANPAIFYVGTAHGGVWKTTNKGTTFDAQFQDQGLMSIGDVTVSQSNPDLVWVGSGESNNRQSTSWGDGVYKSTDGGKTYTNMGLRSSRYINRILIDPRNTDIVFVAATGNLWGSGGDRGVFKTTDSGRTWKQVVKVDDDTGANDLVMDATNNRIMYASTYQRRRTACCMNGGGPGSSIWKSTDAGETWTRLKGNGLPDGPLGRIAIDAYRRRATILYALIEGPAPAGGGRGGAPSTASGQAGSGQAAGGGGGRGGAAAEEAPGGQPPAGGGGRGLAQGVGPGATGLYRSDDAGATWRKVNNVNPRPMYFSQVRIDPNDPEIVYLGGVDLHQSLDGGKTVNTAAASKIHSDHHAIWIDPANSNHVMIGNDGGLAVSYDLAKTWNFVPNLPVGLFYHVSYDMATPYNVCGGMQDNYDWCGPSAVRGAAGIANYHWATIQGGDGFVVLQDPTDFRVAYSESQDGNITRVDRRTFESISIRPQPGSGEPALRWNWDTPLVMSPHDPKVIYAAANKIFRSSDRGLSWVAISSDLTESPPRDEIVTMGAKNSEIQIARNDGIQAWPTVVAFAESPKRAGLLYAGTDDGNLAVSRDGGKRWANIFNKVPGVPKGIWVSEVVPSRFEEGTVYATFDGHRQSDFETHVYASTDFGETWRSMAPNLKGEIARTLTEDVKNPDVLYLGTETGLFVSIDRGKSWTRIKANLPTVRIDEITLHPRDNAMILATHGRAIWILDHLEPIQEYAAAQSAAADARLFTLPPYAWYRRPARDRNYEFWGDQTFFGENPPQAAVISWFMKRQAGDVKLRITDAIGREVREISGQVLGNSSRAGIQSACWDLRVQPAPSLDTPGGGRGGGQAGGQGGREGGPPSTASTSSGQAGSAQAAGGGDGAESPFGDGSPSTGSGQAGGGGGGGGRGGFGGGGVVTAGPFVLPGTYNVSLIVDGKPIEAKPLRVNVDPEVVLTEIERKKMYDMAMEVHDLQRRGTEIANVIDALNRQVTQVAGTIDGKSDVPADVKASFEAFQKELTYLVQKVMPPAGGRGGGGGGGGGRGGPDMSVLGRIGQAKNGLMAGMSPTEQTTRAYNDAKTETPKAIADVNALLTKATALSGTLAKYNITLTVPPAPKSTSPSALK